jgi:PAS domain S-box-containing protein
MSKLRFLLLEDSQLDAELIQAVLQEANFQFDLQQVQSEAAYLNALETQTFDLILSDYSLPGFDGVAALRIAQQRCSETPFIFVSATLGEELAIETLKSGATDYVLKQRLERLAPAIRRALREAKERQDRQRAETALREAKDLYRLLFEQSPFGVLLIRSRDLTFAEFNAQAHQQLGYTSEEFAQLTLADIEATESQAISTEIRTAVRQGFNQFESRHRSKTGELRDVLVTARFIQIGGEPYLHGIWQDITDRKQAESALHQRNERLKLLYEATSGLLSADQPLTLLDDLFKKLATHLDLHCYLSFLVESVEQKTILRLIAHSGISDTDAQTLQNLEAERSLCGLAITENHPVILPQVQQSTHPRAALIQRLGITAYAGYPLVVRGRLLGALSFGSRTRTQFTDGELNLLQATADQVAVALERSNLLASLQQQTEQLTQANRVKDEFLAVLSHELRTPLNPILGWARLLQSRKHDEATVTRALEIIERNAKIQTQLIEDLLDVSRILQGKLSLNVAPVDLVPMIEAALETVRLAAEAKGIVLQFLMTPFEAESFETSAPQLSKFLVLGDAGRLQQVVWNLLSNAVKFTPTGGEVTTELSRVEEESAALKPTEDTKTQRSLPYIQIAVRDTGKGINPNFLPYVFDYFRQADGSTTRTFGGLGLGLAIVRHLVELHGGTIEAASAGENQGATFTVKLPLFQADRHPQYSQVPSPPLPLTAPLNGVKVLLVDDDQDALDFATFLLEQSGATVTATISAQAALEVLSHSQPDVLISDIAMPDQDGYMLLRQVRQLTAPHQQIPAIALTAYAREEDSRHAYDVGFQKHLAKPIEPTVLIAAVAELTTPITTE